jgi:AcrR family transcriptional regulator
VSDIAKTAGMSKGAVHYHFESKDDLIAKVLEHCAAYSLERLREAWESPGQPTEKVLNAVRAMRALRKESAPELRVLADLAAQGLYDERIRNLLTKMFEANRRAFVSYLTRSLSQLQLQPRVPVQVIPRLLLGALDGLAMHDFFDPPGEEDAEEIESAVERIALSLFEM